MGCGKKHSRAIMIPNLTVRELRDGLKRSNGCDDEGPSSIGVDVNFVNYEHVYGIPEHADAFALRSTQ